MAECARPRAQRFANFDRLPEPAAPRGRAHSIRGGRLPSSITLPRTTQSISAVGQAAAFTVSFPPMDKLLLIDDEADVQYSFRRNFGPPEFEVSTASSGEE